LDITQDDKIRKLRAMINIDGNGYKPVSLNKGDSILWKFPESNSMIVSDTASVYKTWDGKELNLYYKYFNKDSKDSEPYEVELKTSDEDFNTYIYKSPYTSTSQSIGQVMDGVFYAKYAIFPSDCVYLEFMYSELWYNNKKVYKYNSKLYYEDEFKEPIGYVTRDIENNINGYYLNDSTQIIPIEKNNRLYYGEQAIEVLPIQNDNKQD